MEKTKKCMTVFIIDNTNCLKTFTTVNFMKILIIPWDTQLSIGKTRYWGKYYWTRLQSFTCILNENFELDNFPFDIVSNVWNIWWVFFLLLSKIWQYVSLIFSEALLSQQDQWIKSLRESSVFLKIITIALAPSCSTRSFSKLPNGTWKQLRWTFYRSIGVGENPLVTS